MYLFHILFWIAELKQPPGRFVSTGGLSEVVLS